MSFVQIEFFFFLNGRNGKRQNRAQSEGRDSNSSSFKSEK